MGNHYHLRFDPKLGHGIYAIRCIPCACVVCTAMIDKPCIYGILSKREARYQTVINCTYWTFMVSYKNWYIINLTSKSTPFETFDEIHKAIIDRISENMASLVQSVMHGAINTDETTKMDSMSFNSSERHIRCK